MAKLHHERIADKLSKKQLQFMNSSSIYPDNTMVSSSRVGWPTNKHLQYTIRNGQVVQGRLSDDGLLVMYQHDLVANPEDYSYITSDVITTGSNLGGQASYGLDWAIDSASYAQYTTDGVQGDVIQNYVTNPPNISQFVGFEVSKSIIDPDKVNEVLDTDIYELMTENLTRQDRINRFFDEFIELIGDPPTFDETNGSIINDPHTDISEQPSNPEASITRLGTAENPGIITNDNITSGGSVYQSLEWMYNLLGTYLGDVLYQPDENVEDERPEYEDVSSGHLEVRNLNHAILIKQEEGRELEFAKEEELTAGNGGQTWWAETYNSSGS